MHSSNYSHQECQQKVIATCYLIKVRKLSEINAVCLFLESQTKNGSECCTCKVSHLDLTCKSLKRAVSIISGHCGLNQALLISSGSGSVHCKAVFIPTWNMTMRLFS